MTQQYEDLEIAVHKVALMQVRQSMKHLTTQMTTTFTRQCTEYVYTSNAHNITAHTPDS
jgi:hypothetical protein